MGRALNSLPICMRKKQEIEKTRGRCYVDQRNTFRFLTTLSSSRFSFSGELICPGLSLPPRCCYPSWDCNSRRCSSLCRTAGVQSSGSPAALVCSMQQLFLGTLLCSPRRDRCSLSVLCLWVMSGASPAPADGHYL
jgi:hypothetical protein